MVDTLPGAGILIPFVYSVEQTYALCLYCGGTAPVEMRVYYNGAVVTRNDKVYSIPAPYNPEDLPGIKFAQSADTLFLVHPRHPVMRLLRYGHSEWEFSEVVFAPGIQPPDDVTLEATGFTDPTGTYVATTADYCVSSVDLHEHESLPSDEVTADILSTWPSNAKVKLTWSPVPGAVRYEVYKNTRGFYTWIGSTKDTELIDDNIEGDDSLGPKDYRNPFGVIPVPSQVEVLSGDGGTLNIEYRAAYIDAFGVVGAASESRMSDLKEADVTFGIPVHPEAASYILYVREPGSNSGWAQLTAEPPEAGDEEETPELVEIDVPSMEELLEDTSGTPKERQDNFPGAIGIYQQRLVFGRTDAEPQTVWMSESGAFNSFSVATPMRDDSAITATVDTKQMNEIRHFIALRDMLMLTSGAEFKVNSGTNNGAVTPMSIAFPIQSYWGSSDVPPIVSGSSILLVQNSNRHVRDLAYTIQEDGYSGNEISILAEHLFDADIVDWAYQQAPYSTVWVCLANGRLLTLTYMREQEIWAWSEHQSSGAEFKSVTSIREGAEDAVYFLVKRGDSFFIEYQVKRRYGDAVEKAFYVDCGLRYSGAPVQHITGLSHLAGKEIAVLADGSAFLGIKVEADGSFDLQAPAKEIAAGLPYSMHLKTLNPEIRSEEGATVGEKKNIVRVVLNLRESRTFSIGPSESSLMTAKLPVQERWDEAPPLFTGSLSVPMPGAHREDITLVIEAPDPVPCTILGMNQYISIG
jgi:hypothetical protein